MLYRSQLPFLLRSFYADENSFLRKSSFVIRERCWIIVICKVVITNKPFSLRAYFSVKTRRVIDYMQMFKCFAKIRSNYGPFYESVTHKLSDYTHGNAQNVESSIVCTNWPKRRWFANTFRNEIIFKVEFSNIRCASFGHWLNFIFFVCRLLCCLL